MNAELTSDNSVHIRVTLLRDYVTLATVRENPEFQHFIHRLRFQENPRNLATLRWHFCTFLENKTDMKFMIIIEREDLGMVYAWEWS